MSDYSKMIASLSPEKRALFEARLKKKGSMYNSFPVSFSQQRLWFLDQLEPGNSIYNIPSAVRLSGELDVAALKRSVHELVRRHEILRTTFMSVNGEPMQMVAPSRQQDMPIIDLSQMDEPHRDAMIQRLAVEEAERPFDLGRGPLLRTSLIRLSDTEHIALYTMHHIISDGWSMGVLIREIAILYDAYSNNRPSPLPDLPLQYADFAKWQRQWQQGEVIEKQLDYWKQQLGDTPPVLELPTDRTRPAEQTSSGADVSFKFSRELSERLNDVSRRNSVTLFMTLLAGFQTLLHRYTQQDDIAVGSPIANRTRAETEALIGFFVNTLVLRSDLSGNPTFKQLLARVRETTLGAYANQDVPFEKLVEVLQPDRDLSHTPLFQVMFILQNTPVGASELPTLSMHPLKIESRSSEFDITLSMNEDPEGLSGALQYNSDLFNAETMSRMLVHFQMLLEHVAINPDAKLSDISLVPAAERHQLLHEWNDTKQPLPEMACIHRLFEQTVESAPGAVAVMRGDDVMTYRELNARANQCARYLRRLGVGADSLVGINLDRSFEMIVGLMGILKAGAGYVPLDPNYPADRLEFMIRDARLSVILTRQALAESLPSNQATIVRLDSDWNAIAAESMENAQVSVDPKNIAYVIYTSGSTGKPKGVVITHQSVVNHNLAVTRLFELTPADRVLQFASINFDAAVEEIFPTLLRGAAVVIRDGNGVLPSGAELQSMVRKYNITVLDLPTAYWHEWVYEQSLLNETAPDSLRLVIVGGDKASAEKLIAWRRSTSGRVAWINTYGPTEATVIATAFELKKDAGDWDSQVELPIGSPIQNTTTYILDSHLQPAPVGIPGELYIGGLCLARGYLDRPELTAEKFIPDPFGEIPGARMYRTGDLVRYRPDGQIEFIGRADFQVKIRGFRVELGEVESALLRHPSVRETIVIVREEAPGDKRMVAYCALTPDAALSATDVRNYLAGILPEYMVPTAVVLLESLPKTPNGKIDRRALPSPEFGRPELESVFVAPRTPAEELIADIWSQVLHVRKVGAFDSFFELGGHSLLATQVVSRVRDVFQVELPLRSLFESPTVAAFAQHIEQAKMAEKGIQAPPIRKTSRQQPSPLSFAQQRLWFMDQLEPGSAMYNIPDAVRLTGALNVDALQQSLREIVRRHEILRTSFQTVDGKATQVIADSLELDFPMIDLSDLPETMREEEALRLILAEAKKPFDLGKAPMLRTLLIRLSAGEHIILLTMHHVASDGWSTGVLIREVAALYDAFSHGQSSPLPELAIHYADYASWQRNWLKDDVLEVELDYWKKLLSDRPTILELPTDFSRPAVQTSNGDHITFTLTKELSNRLNDISRKQGATPFMTLLAAFQTLLHRYTGQQHINVGTPIANRTRSEAESLIGFFVNTLVLHADFSQGISFNKLLRQVRETTLGAYAHQDVPFEKIVDAIQPERDMSRTPLFQAMFILQNTPKQSLVLEGLRLEAIELDTKLSTFDITLSLGETEAGYAGAMEFNTDLFRPSTIHRMIAHFKNLLQSLSVQPDLSVLRLPILDEIEQQRILVEWNKTDAAFPDGACYHELFQKQVEKTPSAIALISGNGELTYSELNERANQLAHHLRKIGVGPEKLVGMCIERSPEMIIGLLAILKAGGGYVPLDPDYPEERLTYMMTDSKLSHLLTKSHLAASLPTRNMHVIRLDTDWELISREVSTSVMSGVAPDNVAYVIYTSGSTGKPKGVMISHRSVVNHNFAVMNEFQLTNQDRVLQFASINFDAAVEEIFPTLLCGATLVLRNSDGGLTSGAELLELIRSKNLTMLDLPTAYWHEWVYEMTLLEEKMPSSLRLVIVGGDKASPERLAAWQRVAGKQVRLLNTYGPTEGTIIATSFDPNNERNPWQPGTDLPIGAPIANLKTYVLDAALQPVPVGVAGELHIGGAGVARGYLNRPDLTADKFIPDPHSNAPGARLYKTGDLVRYRENGDIEFVGRVDHQVKIRGFRVELSEIESVLERHPSLREVVVVAREDAQGAKKLVAYCVAGNKNEADSKEQRRHERVPFLSEVTIKLNGDEKALFKTEDISPGGARLLTISPIPNWQAIQQARMAMKLPIAPQQIHFNSDLIWQENGRIGIAFRDMSLDNKTLIDETIIRLKENQFVLMNELRNFLKDNLPEYMVPSAFVILERLPRTPSGKIDRKALPEPNQERVESSSAYVEARDEVEESLTKIWSQVLGIGKIGVNDNFFELGGDSILSIQVIAQANKAGIRLTPKQLFEQPTIAGLASVAGKGQAVFAEQGEVTGEVPLTPIQKWFFDLKLPESHHWNQSVLFEIEQHLKPNALRMVIKSVIEHHDALRFRYAGLNDAIRQHIAANEESVPFSIVDLSALPETELQRAIESVAASVQQSLNLEFGPIIRAALFHLGDSKPQRLLIVAHHLAIDGVSWRILLEDVMTSYQQFERLGRIQLPQKTTSFKYWAEQLSRHARTPELEKELEYWLEIGKQPIAPLKTDFTAGKNTEASAGNIAVSLTEAETKKLLKDVPAVYRTQINDILLTALAQTFGGWMNSRSVLVEMEGHGREDLFGNVDISRTLGWFTTVYPVLLNLGVSRSIGDEIKNIKEQLRKLPNHGIGFGLLKYMAEKSEVTSALRTLPEPQISFNYLGQFDQAGTNAGAFKGAKESSGPDHSPMGERSHFIEINGSVAGSRLQLDWTYSENIHARATIERLAYDFIARLKAIIAHCENPNAGGVTPSDFPLANLKQKDLNKVLNKLNKTKEKRAL
ncbi:MAG: amino acid adenylation domain-containing protein [Candidatus Zhuqueibacterota bacterium]